MAEVDEIFKKQVLMHDNMKMLVLASASFVITECEKWQPDGDQSNDPTEGVLGHLAKNINWATHGYINALQAHVELIKAYQVGIIEKKVYLGLLEEQDLKLINESLTVYQEWKSRLIQREKEIHGRNWGDAGGFNTAVWNNRNKDIDELIRKAKER